MKGLIKMIPLCFDNDLYVLGGIGLFIGDDKNYECLKPKQIIQREDSKTTIVFWKDGSKTIVRCSSDEKFVPEFGVAMATMKKIYGNRNAFKKFIEDKTFLQDKLK